MPSYTRRVSIPGKSSEELYEKVSESIDRFLGKASIGKYEIERQPELKVLNVKSSMFSAKLSCLESQMELKADLSFLAMPFKGKLDEGIDKWLFKTFNLTKTT